MCKKWFYKGQIVSLALLLMAVARLDAQEAWDRQVWGNHRAVVQVEADAPVVHVHLSWRRRDDPAGKAVFVVDASSGRRIAHVYALAVNRESGDFIFEPATGKGRYYFYYLPYRQTGSWYFPNTVYRDARLAYDSAWERSLGNEGSGRYPEATVLRLESVDNFNSFDPMEIVATREEVDSLLRANKGADFLVFPEDRKQPIRMEDDLPRCWVQRGAGADFSGTALRNEFYVYQLGVYAAYKDMRGVRLTFSDLVGEHGERIPASDMRCFNFGGRDWEGKTFTKTVDVDKGQVQALWVGLDLGKTVHPGLYSGEVSVGAAGMASRRVHIRLRVQDSISERRGYEDLFRMARLNWLDSRIGIDDSVFKPYTPVTVEGNAVHVLGRTLWFDRYGLPGRITSTFEGSNASCGGPEKDILAGSVRVEAMAGGRDVDWKGARPVIVEKAGGLVRWTTELEGEGLRLEIDAGMECDGYVNYALSLTAMKEMDLDDIRLQIPYAPSAATYMMGLGCKGGRRPDHWDWKWEKSKANNMVWLGGVNAGLQCKLKNATPDWTMTNFDKTGTYKDWSNDGLGGATLRSAAGRILFTAFTGRRHVVRGQVLHFNFGLLITPVKLLDPAHWNERYFQADPPVDTWRKVALAKGANVMNVHQGNILNPYINYPFVAIDTLRRYTAINRALGIRTKVYYTVRELSNRTPELWAFRSLGDEIFTPGLGSQVADQFADDGTGGNLYCTGGSWLVEHLVTRYDAAWHTPLPGGDYDMAIRTQGLSRLHNYYLEGLNWLIRDAGVRGIYLDGVGYDREIMKRVRKVMDRAADSCLIDMHSGNNFSPTYGLNSPANQYMELFPFLNSLWLGEGYNYDENPDYWLVEVSGIPFGLYGEMLNNGGNAYRGMLYGMTNRLGWTGCDPSALWRLWDVFGIRDSRMVGYWDPACPVRANRDDVKVTVYRQAGKIMIAYASWAAKDVHVRLDVDWKALHMDPGHVTIVAPAVAGLQEEQVYGDLSDIRVPAGKGGWIICAASAPQGDRASADGRLASLRGRPDLLRGRLASLGGRLVVTARRYDGLQVAGEDTLYPYPGASRENGLRLEVDARLVPKEPGAIDVTATCRANAALPATGVAFSLSFSGWDPANYVLVPAAVYNGNRYRAIGNGYNPPYPKDMYYNPSVPLTISNNPRLAVEKGHPSRIELQTGNVSTPALCFFSARAKKGFIVLTTQGTRLGENGLVVAENARQDSCSFEITAPAMRKLAAGFGDFHPSGDKAPDWAAGDSLMLRFRVFVFDAPDIPALLRKFFNVRKSVTGPNEPRNLLPKSQEFKLGTDISRSLWSENPAGNYYLPENSRNFQLGWVGGLMNTYPLLVLDSPLERERVGEEMDFVVHKLQCRSGFFYGGITADGRIEGEKMSPDFPAVQAMVRKNGDALFWMVKHLELLRAQGHGALIKTEWETSARKLAGAFVRTWKRYGQFGQYIVPENGDIAVFNSAAGAIVPAGLVLAYDYFRDPVFLATAGAAAAYYYRQFVVRQGLTGGNCGDISQDADSESAFAFLESLMALYHATRDHVWLERAETEAALCSTWVLSYDEKFPAGSDIDRIGAHMAGAVFASIQNKHAAPGICTSSGDYLFKLYRATGNRLYADLIRDIQHAAAEAVNRPGHLTTRNLIGSSMERIQPSDAEGRRATGNFINTRNTWTETDGVLMALELPGVYVQTDTKRIMAFDHVSARLSSGDDGGLTLELENPTEYDALVTVMAETSSQAAIPMGYTGFLKWPVVRVKAGGRTVVHVSADGRFVREPGEGNPKPFVIPGLQAWDGGVGQFHVDKRTAIVIDAKSADRLKQVARLFQSDIREMMGGGIFPVKTGRPAAGDIWLSLRTTDSTLGMEGYRLEAGPKVLRISGVHPQGVFWGTRTVLQVLEQDSLHRNFPCGLARDLPKYAIRGFVLDAGRKFFSMDFLKAYVKFMAYYKMNDFHIHLNDDGGHRKGSPWDSAYAAFRLQCDTYPGLTATDGFYTKAEFRAFEAFARSYGVNIVPEIDVPAHSLAFTRMRPEIASKQYGADHLDLDNPVTYRVIDSVFREYLVGPNPVFSGPDVHIGTDEYNKQAAEQFRAFTDHYIRLVQGYGKRVRLWGALTHAPGVTPVTSKGVTMNVWYNGYADPTEMEKLGYDIISTPDDWVYIVPHAGYYHDYLDTAKLYNEWEPIMVGNVRFPEGDPQIKGGSFAVWNDKLGSAISDKDVYDRVFPAMQVLSQKMWRGSDAAMSFTEFSKRAGGIGAGPGFGMAAK